MQQFSNLHEKAQFSLFWAFYNLLPASLRNSFISIAEDVAKDYREGEKRGEQSTGVGLCKNKVNN